MDWIAFGTWLAVAYCGAFAFVGAALALRKYRRAAPLSAAAALFFASVGTVAAQKGGGTNEPPRLAARPLRTAAQTPRGVSAASAKVAKINARGAWRDSFLLDFGGGFLFPFGTNRLSSVEIFTQGYARPRRRSAEFVADTGLRAALVPGVSSLAAELTPSNSWRVAWSDAAQNRDTNALVSASIEFMRNGDMSVTTNGVSRTLPRVLPFAHNGFGQDDEWVAANFTNATEIAAAGGYAQWVDAQVGSGLTNGLYKFTVTIADTPPETVQLVVGDFSVAVTNAGEYVFLLEKGIEYEYGTDPYLSCVAYAAVDDVPRLRARVHLRQTAEGDEVGWTTDGGFENLEPSIDSVGRVVWWPDFYGSPDVSHIWPGDGPFVFEAVLSDYCGKVAPIYSWTASDTLAVASPGAQSTEVDVGTLPSWAEVHLSVTAKIGDKTLYSRLGGLTCGTNDTPRVYCSAYLPSSLLVRGEWMEGSESAMAHVTMTSDVETNGTLHVWIESGEERTESAMALPAEFEIAGEKSFKRSFAIDGIAKSLMADDVRLCCAFVSEDGATNAFDAATSTIVSAKRVLVPSAPETGLCVLRGASVSAALEIEPSVDRASVRWQTAKRKTKAQYDRWTERIEGARNVSLTMDEAGVFALRAVLVCGGGCQSNAVEFVHSADEPYVDAINERRGPVKEGERNHIGVAATQSLLGLRNAALAHLGNAEYGTDMYVWSNNGFSVFVSGKNKCNRFVADVAFEAGLSVPVMHVKPHTWLAPDGAYPPLANEWANGNVDIPGWVYLGRDVYPEPGFIAGHPSPTHGHCGIVDYDGWTISARPYGVGRKSESMLDGNCGYNKPMEEDNNEE